MSTIVRLTVTDLIDYQVFAILRELKDEWLPLRTITEEVLIFEESKNLILVDEDGTRTRFTKEFVDIIRRAFKNVEWFLSKPSKREGVEGLPLLIGVWPWEHYLVLAPKKMKKLDQ